MHFSIQLSAYYPDKSYGGDRVCGDMLEQIDAFNRAKAELGATGAQQTLSLSRVAFLSHNDADRNRKIQLAHDYYRRFDNVFTGPGIVENGMIKPLPRKMAVEQTAENLTIKMWQQVTCAY
jgi:hypothetical protein